jgi:hypothetical protein
MLPRSTRQLSAVGNGGLFWMDVGSGYSVQQVVQSNSHTCALLRPGGVVKCWG